MKTSKEIVGDLRHLFSKVDWGKSFLDARAVTIMNEVFSDIRGLDSKSGKARKVVIKDGR